MIESELLSQVLLSCSRGDTRLFRSNSGTAWQGRIIEHTRERLVMLYPKPVRLMAEGFADTCGWRTRVIVPADVGGEFAQWVSLELKVGRRQPTAEQLAFLAAVRRAGGLAGVVRSVEEARQLLGPAA